MLQAADVGKDCQPDITNLIASGRQSVEHALGYAMQVVSKMLRYILALNQHLCSCLPANQHFQDRQSHSRITYLLRTSQTIWHRKLIAGFGSAQFMLNVAV